MKRGAGTLVGGHEPFFEFGRGRHALGGGEPSAAIHELRDVLERATARVVERDLVHEPAVDCHVRLFEVGDIVRPGGGDGLELFGGGQAYAELDALEDFALGGGGEVAVFDLVGAGGLQVFWGAGMGGRRDVLHVMSFWEKTRLSWGGISARDTRVAVEVVYHHIFLVFGQRSVHHHQREISRAG